MLSIHFGTYTSENYIDNPDLFFDNTYEDSWLEDPLSKKMVADIDRSELVGPNLVISPVLGSISINRLSGGVKTLIQISKDPDHVYNASSLNPLSKSVKANAGASDILYPLRSSPA